MWPMRRCKAMPDNGLINPATPQVLWEKQSSSYRGSGTWNMPHYRLTRYSQKLFIHSNGGWSLEFKEKLNSMLWKLLENHKLFSPFCVCVPVTWRQFCRMSPLSLQSKTLAVNKAMWVVHEGLGVQQFHRLVSHQRWEGRGDHALVF